MVYLWYVKRQILYYYQQGHRLPAICKLLKEEEKIDTTCVGIAKFIDKFEWTGLIAYTPGSGRPMKITEEMMAIVEE